MSNGYPFVTKNEIAKRIASEPAFATECVCLVDERRGWMASHRARAARLVARIAVGDLSPDDLVEAIALARPYSRTISRILRERQVAEGAPELVAQAAVFGIVRSGPAPSVASADAAPVPAVDTTAPEASTATPKRRGRPKGSKNRPKGEAPLPKRRRRRS